MLIGAACCRSLQDGADCCRLVQGSAGSCSFVQIGAVWCRSLQVDADLHVGVCYCIFCRLVLICAGCYRLVQLCCGLMLLCVDCSGLVQNGAAWHRSVPISVV